MKTRVPGGGSLPLCVRVAETWMVEREGGAGAVCVCGGISPLQTLIKKDSVWTDEGNL